MRSIILIMLVTLSSMAISADLRIQLFNAPSEGQLVFQVYNSADAFGDFRDPKNEVIIPVNDDGNYLITDVAAGRIALLVYHDANLNGIIDKNFIGIPRERLALSNNYRPKGPPSFDRASFELGEMQSLNLEMEMFQILGNRGQWGVGIGMIGKTSPYLNASQSAYQFIPAITYVGERLQVFGPQLRFGLVGSGNARLAVSAAYRIGAYKENDSNDLMGLGNRKSTLMAGLSLQYDMPRGIELELGYEHDTLDRVGGGIGSLSLSRGFQYKMVRVSPELSLTWLSKQVSNHDFGVPVEAATGTRPAYALGSTTSFGLGLSSFIELSERWQLIVNIKGDLLPDEITNSPIVADDTIISGFAAITYVF